MIKYADLQDELMTTVRPQDDFFHYVNQQWLDARPIPASESRWGTFEVLRDTAAKDLRTIYEDLQNAQHTNNSIEQQAADLYHTSLHIDDTQAANLKVLESYLDKIEAIKDVSDLSNILGQLHKSSVSVCWRLIIDASQEDSSQHILRLQQSGLTLPNKDYYLDSEAAMQAIRAQYQKFALKVMKTFPCFAATETNEIWGTVFSFEVELANNSRSDTELRDIQKNNNPTTFASLQEEYPHIAWREYCEGLGWDGTGLISIDQPEFFAHIDQQIKDRSLNEWKAYLKWRLIATYMPYVSEKLSKLHFSFFGKILAGKKQMQPRWKQAVFAVEGAIGEGTGKLYAAKYFPESSKQQVLAMVEDIRLAYHQHIDRLDWMSDATQAYAKKKLDNIKVLIGYPDKWRDFSTLKIERTSLLKNIIAAREFETAYWLGRLSAPTSRDDWYMTPQTVNAYHDPNRLVICFPAAILQPPFFDPAAPLALNMGGIGMVIGHEFTHGFDDQGCQFDANGNVKAWQTASERQAFTSKANVLMQQASDWEVLPDLFMKGGLVIGEAIADLGGLEIALTALRNKLPNLGTEAVPGLTHQQLFFIGHARAECAAVRPEFARMVALSDPHPDSIFRVNGTLKNMHGFYEAFNLTASDKLYLPPSKRAKIW